MIEFFKNLTPEDVVWGGLAIIMTVAFGGYILYAVGATLYVKYKKWLAKRKG